jgi:hypothetical protein
VGWYSSPLRPLPVSVPAAQTMRVDVASIDEHRCD